MDIETALMTYLLAQSGITALVGQKIHFMRAPQSTSTPYIIVSKIDAPRSYTHDGADGLVTARFQLSCFADKYGDAKSVVSAIQTAMNAFSCPGTMGGDGGVTVGAIFYDDETDLDPGESGPFGVAADYIIHHKE